jgi:hypothetical protein
VHRVLNGEPGRDAITGDLRGLIEACLAKDPVARPSTSAILDHLADPGGRPLPVAAPAAPDRPTQPRGTMVATRELAAGSPALPPAGTRRTSRRAVVLGAFGADTGGAAVAVGPGFPENRYDDADRRPRPHAADRGTGGRDPLPGVQSRRADARQRRRDR